MPLSATSFLLCHTPGSVVQFRFSGLLNKGGLPNDPSVHCCWSPHASAAALWFHQTLNWSLNWPPVYFKNELASEWEGYKFLSCSACPGMTAMVPLHKVHHTAIPPQKCQSLLDGVSLHRADETLCSARKNVLGEEKNVRSGLLQEKSISAWVFCGFFFFAN